MNKSKFLTDEERKELETFLKSRLEVDPRDACMLLLALHTGARPSELIALTWKDIDLKGGEIYIQTIKGGVDRVVLVPTWLRLALVRLNRLEVDRPFNISRRRLTQIWYEYRTVEKPLKSLRHTFGIAVVRNCDVRLTQQMMGHKSITSTMVYASYVYPIKDYKRMMRIK